MAIESPKKHGIRLTTMIADPGTPNAAAVQRALSRLEDDILGPYETPGNHLSRTMYDNLMMPWQMEPPVAAFPSELFVRHEWNRDGKIEEGEDDFFGGSEVATLAELERALGTASMVTRWREDHVELVGTDNDCVRKTMRDIAEVMKIDDTDLPTTKLRSGNSTALLLFTRASG
jgi:hypothetical protein